MKYVTNEILIEQQIINFRTYTLSIVIPSFIFNWKTNFLILILVNN